MAQASGDEDVDAGAWPGVDTFEATITSADCEATSIVEAWILPEATADHTVDEHIVDPPRVVAHTPAAGSFKVTLVGGSSNVYGDWHIGWAHT